MHRTDRSEERDLNNNSKRSSFWGDIRNTPVDSPTTEETLGSRLESLKITSEPPKMEIPYDKPQTPRCEHQSWTQWEQRESRRSPESPNEELIRFTQEKAKEWKTYPMNLIDTHCHFDMLFSR